MADWNSIPEGPLIEILERLSSYKQFISTDLVSRRWRSARRKATFPSKSPILLLSTSNNSLHFYSLLHRRIIHRIDPPFLIDDAKSTSLSSHGWLLCVSSKEFSLSIFDPFSGRCVQLPDKKSLAYVGKMIRSDVFVSKFIMSGDPNETDDYVVAISYGDGRICELGVWRAGDDRWWNSENDSLVDGILYDIVLYNGELFSFHGFGAFFVPLLSAWKFGNEKEYSRAQRRAQRGEREKQLMMDGRLAGKFFTGFPHVPGDKYLIVMDDRLMICCTVLRVSAKYIAGFDAGLSDMENEFDGIDPTVDDDEADETIGFRVIEMVGGAPKKVTDLENKSVFLGRGKGVCFEADNGCKANHIYFIEESKKFSSDGEEDICIGAFDMASSNIEHHHTRVPRKGPGLPTWFECA